MHFILRFGFAATFIGSIVYLVVHMGKIDPEYKKQVATMLAERRSVIEAKCKVIADIPERFNCYYHSSNALKDKLKSEEIRINSYFMYKNTFELNLGSKVLESAEYKGFRAKLLLSILSDYGLLDSKRSFLKRENLEELRKASESLGN